MEAPVVGGTPVPPDKWPDAVLVVAREAMCTGTLIAPNVVLTAGHCIAPEPVEVWTNTVDYGESPGERIPVLWSLAYPDWENTFDVGILLLARDASPPPRTVAGRCTAREALVRDAPVQLVGFGLTTESGTGSNTVLHEATLHVTDPTCTTDAACNAAIAPDGEFLAGGGGIDACFGDSGGPIYITTAHGPALAGVVSRGRAIAGAPCATGGVFVRADKVALWVQQKTGEHLVRTTCSGKSDDEDDDDDDGGCAANRPGGLAWPCVLVALVLVRRRRRG